MLKDKIKKDDVLCFFGDSITSCGKWIAEVYQNIPQVKIINCGVSGDSACRALFRLYSDCLVHFPEHVVLMFGMNDIGRDLYSPEHPDENRLEKAEENLRIYEKSMRAVIERCLKSGANMILCTPTPCDDIHDFQCAKLMCNTGLERCADIVTTLSKEYQCDLVDFYHPISKVLDRDAIIKPDRVHPTDIGHHYMAQEFLVQMGITAVKEFETPFVMNKKNKERYELEQILRAIAFVEYNVLYELNQNKPDLSAKKNKINQLLSVQTNLSDRLKIYMENIDNIEALRGKLIEMTMKGI